MSVANVLPAVALLGGIVVIGGSATIRAVLPSPAPVEIHQLEYNGGYVTQASTYRTPGDFGSVRWMADVVDAETDEPVSGCEGSGARQVDRGDHAATKPLDQWIGSLSCIASILPEGRYYLRTTVSSNWVTGEDTFRSEPFEVGR